MFWQWVDGCLDGGTFDHYTSVNWLFNLYIGDILTSLIASKDSSSDTTEDIEQLLKLIFTSYITCDESFTKQQLQIMITRLQAIDTSLLLHSPLTALESLILRLHSQYPSDIGVFSPLLMNYIVLEKGQSFFIGANELHAYISGECSLPLSVYWMWCIRLQHLQTDRQAVSYLKYNHYEWFSSLVWLYSRSHLMSIIEYDMCW